MAKMTKPAREEANKKAKLYTPNKLRVAMSKAKKPDPKAS